MKRLRLIVLICAMLFAVDAAAQPVYVMQSGTRTPQTCPNGFACSAAVDANNNVYVTSSGTPIPFTPSLAEAVLNPMVVFLATAVPTAVPTPQFVNTTAMKHSFVDNSTNQEVYVHLNGSITPIARVQPGTVWFRNWGATGSKMSGSIAVTRPGTLPTTGSIAIGGDS